MLSSRQALYKHKRRFHPEHIVKYLQDLEQVRTYTCSSCDKMISINSKSSHKRYCHGAKDGKALNSECQDD
jgi:hypothetical protein